MSRLATNACLILLSGVLFAGCDLASEPSANQTAKFSKPLEGDLTISTAMDHFNQREFKKAIPHFQAALNQPLALSTRSEVMTALGNCYSELGNYEQALLLHQKAIDEDPTNHMAHVNKGIALRNLNRHDEAAQAYAEALKIEPDYAELHASLGALSYVREDYDSAIQQLRKAIELDDTLAVAHSNLALAYAAVGRFLEADKELQKAVTLGYHQPDVIRELIEERRQESRK